ncbi:transcription elongation factor B, polypeptide 1 [Angomonas deanei]|uniref:Uncharacterized protein n=1 Tax=Angomonas deanei TaxID=59799 RepID=A0A7G2CK99_9TRYP|nr:transcription elongation factor B, polypeptide 1 [Angomonas deanei]CAD2219043.1 hypothetical protein, conserved [Angomonas deanei]|eukprot:EPY29818.1 transcription elongation factor B, polypeptide 1 [Angomonas deanei]
MSSGLPFNPMRKTPPPPPHMDTVGVNASEYVSVYSSELYEFIVHLECLRQSPLLRRVLEKGSDIHLTEMTVEFVGSDETSSTASPSAAKETPYSYVDRRLHNTTVRVAFPTLTNIMTETLIKYLHQKYKFEVMHVKELPSLEIAAASAIPLLKVASVLEC